MATTTVVEDEGSSSKALKCQTWVLKVSIHCQGCKRKVKKVLLGIDGVYTATIDSQQQRVTVTGNIEAEKLIKRLIKRGKHAEIWPETSPSENKEPGKPKNTHKQNNTTNKEEKNTVTFTQQTPYAATSAETTTVSEESPESNNNNAGENGSSGKKKKRKGQKRENINSNSNSTINSPSSGKAEDTGFQSDGMGTNQSNLSPTRKQSGPLPYPQQGYNIPPAYASTYSYRMAYPREYSYPGNYLNAPAAVSPYPKGNPPESFFYFSDENVHGCSIM